MRLNLRKLDGMDDLFIEYPKTVDWTLDYEIFPIVRLNDERSSEGSSSDSSSSSDLF